MAWKEKLLAHHIEQVEKAGYYVIPRDRVERLQAQQIYDTGLEDAFRDEAKNLCKWEEKNMLLSMAYELGKVVRWEKTENPERMQRIVRAILTVIKPKEDQHESSRCVPRFSDAPGRYALNRGYEKTSSDNTRTPGAG